MIFRKSKIFKLENSKLPKDKLRKLREVLANGGIVVFPTETVYALGCLYDNKEGREKIFELKKRNLGKKLPIMVKNPKTIEDSFKCSFSSLAKDVICKFLPGPLTVVLNCSRGDSFGFRIPAHDFVIDLISACDKPLVATSANISREEPACDFRKAYSIFSNKVDVLVDGGKCWLSESSTVIDLQEKGDFKILREGVYSQDLIKKALSNPKSILFVCTGNSCRSIMTAAFLKKELESNKINGIKVTSAGTAALEGMPPSQDTMRILSEENIGTSYYRSKRVTLDMLREADLILTMEKIHLDYIMSLNSQLKCKTFNYLEFAFGSKEEIQDPIGKGIDEYIKIFAIIKKATEQIIKKIT